MNLRFKHFMVGGLFALFGLLPSTAALAAEQTLFTTQVPQDMSLSDGVGVNYELGLRFKSTAAGYIKAIRFYKSPSETGSHTGKIYSSTGTLLASVAFSGETSSGWQQQSLSTPLSITANTTYTVSVNTGNTYYVDTVQGLASQVTNGNLKSIVGNNGVYGPVGQRPTNSFNNSNYFRDVVFDTTLSSDSTPPTVSLTNPANRQFAAAGATVTLQANASDNVGVARVEFYVDGNLICSDTGSPFTCDYVTSNSGNVANVVQAKAFDAANNSATSSSNTMYVSGPASTWQNVSFSAQTGSFTAEFDAIPSASTEDVVVGLSNGAAAAYTDLAAIVRFGNGGVIDVRNGAAYGADQVVTNVAGTLYHFRMLVNVATKKYTVYVTPEGQSEVLLANNYNFRDSQSTVASLANRGKFNEAGDVAVLNFTVTPTSSGQKPTASNTGWQPTGVTLTPSGSLNITTAGTVIDGLDITGNVIINANNVTIKRSRVRSSFYYPIWVQSGSNVTIEDVEVDGLGGPNDGGQKCIYVPNGGTLIQRNNLHDCEDGMSLGGAVTVQYNYVHTPNGPASQHSDGMEYYGGSGATISYNNFDYVGATTSASNFTNDFGAISNIVYDHNWLAGGSFNLYLDGSHGGGPISNIQVTNNRFVRNSSENGPALIRNVTGLTWTGNVYDDNGEVIP